MFDGENRLEAYSNVRIIGDSVVVSGQRLTYDGKTKIADITGNVRMTDPSSVLTTSRLQFDNNTKQAIYTNGGKSLVKRMNLLVNLGCTIHASEHFIFETK